MYNETQKNAFIASHTNSDKTTALIVQIFNWFEPYENEWQCDLSQQSTEVLQPVVNELTGVRSKSTELILIILKEYVKWCGRSGYEVSRGIFDVRINTIDKIQSQMVASPLHLKSILDRCEFDTPNKETVDVTYRVFLWMAFAGLDDKDAIRVTTNDVDLQNLRINFEGHSYEIYKECREDFEKACCLTDFLYEHPNYSIRRDRAEGNIIMRGFRSPTVDLKTLRPLINKKLTTDADGGGETKTRQKSKLSYKRIYLSGIFYRAYERERAGIPVDFSDVVALEMQRKEKVKQYTTSKTRTLSVIANMIEREYLADYEKWKCAFAM